MKKVTLVGGLATVVTAVAAVGQPALAGLGVLLVLGIGMVCWVVANRGRTSNFVAIIRATRGQSDGKSR